MIKILGIFLSLQILYISKSDSKICETDVCKKLGHELKLTIDNKVDPCEDFSSYICGNFDKVFSIPPGERRFTSMGEIGNEIQNELKHLLENQTLSNPKSPQTKAAIFYKSCLDMEKRNLHGKSTILNFINKTIQRMSYDENLKNLLTTGLSSRIVNINSAQDPINPEYNILEISKPSLILSEATLRSPDTDKNKEQIKQYKKYMSGVLDYLGIWTNKKTNIDDIVEFNIKIAKAFPSLEDQNNPEKYSNKVSIKYLQNKCPEISWKNLINGVTKGTGKQFKDEDVILLFSMNYTDALYSILKEYKADSHKRDILEMDLQWALISSVAPLGSNELVELAAQLERDLFGTTGKKDLWKKCLDTTSNTLVDIISNMYVKESFQASKKKDIEFMINNIKKSFKKVLEEINWMDPNTKSYALEKLSTIKTKIGYPDSLLNETKLMKDNENVVMDIGKFMENYIKYGALNVITALKDVGEKIPDDAWSMGSHVVNAYYNPSSNEIVFPAAILRYPIYDIKSPITFNYGGIGMVFAHEILHGFDTAGSKYDSKGLLKQWWTKASLDKYMTKTKCIVDQYGKYSIYNESLPSEQTLGEDIADNAGLRMSYLAVHSEHENREQLVLPGLNFTAEQLFFVGHARTWCGIYTKNGLLELMKGDVHTVWKFRINGPMSNMPEFSKAFKCDRNKAMNRLKKCIVW